MANLTAGTVPPNPGYCIATHRASPGRYLPVFELFYGKDWCLRLLRGGCRISYIHDRLRYHANQGERERRTVGLMGSGLECWVVMILVLGNLCTNLPGSLAVSLWLGNHAHDSLRAVYVQYSTSPACTCNGNP